MIPMWIKLTHRRMQLAVSFVAGVMLGVGVLIMLPHAIAGAAAATGTLTHTNILGTMTALLAGMLAMFFIERFFCFHHHDVPDDDLHDRAAHDHDHHAGCDHDHEHVRRAHHDITWSGAAVGMTLHSIVDGVALAASVQHGDDSSWLAGFGTFLVILLHKPFDSMTIGMLMARGNWSTALAAHGQRPVRAGDSRRRRWCSISSRWRSAGSNAGNAELFIAHALAFSAGTFLCISLSDLAARAAVPPARPRQADDRAPPRPGRRLRRRPTRSPLPRRS